MTSPAARAALGRATIVLVVLACAIGAALVPIRPPAPVAASAPRAEFSSARAMRHVDVLASGPRAMGSAAHEEARRYLVRELQALALETQVQETAVVQLRFAARHGGRPAAGTVRNVVGRLHGSEGGRAVLLAAHYDTRGMTPGASDDTMGVATLLETARALASGARPKRDVLFLFTDGEEEGLLG